MLRFQRAWKMYFWFLILLTVVSAGMDIRKGIEGVTVAVMAMGVFGWAMTLINLLGIYGFAWQVPVGRPAYWKAVFVFNVLLTVGWIGYRLTTDPLVENVSTGQTLIALGLVAAFMAPYLIAIYRYAYRSRQLWLAR
jgi:hypothetical protein